MEQQLAPEVLLKETYNYIVEHPEEHDQASWVRRVNGNSCDTAYCFAGMAVHLAGYDINVRMATVPGFDDHQYYKSIRDAAKELLNLDDHDADILFNGYNSIHDIRRILEGWKVL
jgi:hypothetical protein